MNRARLRAARLITTLLYLQPQQTVNMFSDNTG